MVSVGRKRIEVAEYVLSELRSALEFSARHRSKELLSKAQVLTYVAETDEREPSLQIFRKCATDVTFSGREVCGSGGRVGLKDAPRLEPALTPGGKKTLNEIAHSAV
ncbi:MAG: hypothetical protein K0S57_2643 [Ramlibacter sp.]|nr:hypothetical protein [Ramlibacter sp.]